MLREPQTFNRPRRFLRACLVLLTSLIATAADARQDESAEPRQVVTTADGVVVRCGAGPAWYPIATLRAGTVLTARGSRDGWLKVEYLPEFRAVVSVADAELNEVSGQVRLSARTRLRALNQADPVFDESFRAVFDEHLAPGLALRYVGPIKNRAGEVAGYIVVPPPGAIGYVSPREVRDARPGEGAPAAPAAPTPASAPVHQPTTEPPPETHVPPVAEAIAPAAVETPTGTYPPTPPAAPPEPKGPTLRQLDRAFDELMAKPLDAADPQELIEQYNQYGDRIADEPGSGRTLKYIDARVQVLKVRARARDLLPEIQSLEEAHRTAGETYRLTIDRLIRTREYKVVGRLVPSAIYDGQRLPLMYRLVAIDPGVKSTLAYVVPVPEHQLEQKVGAVVGVLGEGRREPSAMVEIITPTLVDVLRPADGSPAQE